MSSDEKVDALVDGVSKVKIDGEKGNEAITVFDDKEKFNIKHPLQNEWTLWFKPATNQRSSSKNWTIKEVITIGYVEDFWAVHNYVNPPSRINPSADYAFFKRGIEPKWEDSANVDGGNIKFTLVQFKSPHLPSEYGKMCDAIWMYLMLAMIGEVLTDANIIHGARMLIRRTKMRVEVWTGKCEPKERIDRLINEIRELLYIPEKERFQFISNKEEAALSKKQDMQAASRRGR